MNDTRQQDHLSSCPLCAGAGSFVFQGVTDVYFGHPGQWDIRQCNDRHCRLWWLEAPAGADSYASYFTHAPDSSERIDVQRPIERAILQENLAYPLGMSAPWTLLGRLLGWIPPARDEAARRVMWLRANPGGKLLDVGCGSGTLLARMRQLGWSTAGVEPDETAAEVARSHHGIDVFTGTVEAFNAPDASYDAVTLNHVIEHAPDPRSLLRECARILRPGGLLVLATPNSASLGRRRFGAMWRGLEVPRHLCLFSPRSMRAAFSSIGLNIVTLRTPARSARWMWATCDAARRGSTHSKAGLWQRLRNRMGPWVFQAIEQTVNVVAPVGEEILVIARKADR